MKYSFFLIWAFASGLLGLIASSCSFTPKQPAGLQLVWSDEFETPGLPDTTKWTYDVGGKGWGNNELQYYTQSDPKNARIEDGMLIIEAHQDSMENRAYTSARLLTRGKAGWKYGRFEIRARMPEGLGTWPAIWMLSDKKPMKWPLDGEIDIMEHVGYNPNTVFGTIHSQNFNHIIGTQKSDSLVVADIESAFHVYTLNWTPTYIQWMVDDSLYFTTPKNNGSYEDWPFDQPFHLILNMAVGGNWGGHRGLDPLGWPRRMEVDYVRVYQ